MRFIALCGMLFLTACGPSATYIQGGKGSSASLDISAATGSGKVMLTGPFVYCSEKSITTRAAKPAIGNLCPPLYEGADPVGTAGTSSQP